VRAVVPLDEYASTVDDAAAQTLRQLDAAVRALGVLRPDTSTLMTWNFPRGGDVDTAAVATYVREALATRDHFLAHAEEISTEARARYGR
jgi:hypothetical protein